MLISRFEQQKRPQPVKQQGTRSADSSAAPEVKGPCGGRVLQRNIIIIWAEQSGFCIKWGGSHGTKIKNIKSCVIAAQD